MFNELFWMAAADAAQDTGKRQMTSVEAVVYFLIFVGIVAFFVLRKKLPEMKIVKQAETKYGKFFVKMDKLRHSGGLDIPTGVDCTARCGASTFMVTYGTQQFAIPTERLFNIDIMDKTRVESQWVNTSFRPYFNTVRRMKTTYTAYFIVVTYRNKQGEIDYILLNSDKDKEMAKFVAACKPYCNQTAIDNEL